MKKTLLSLVLILAVLRILSAAPAYRGPVTRTQPDGSTIVTYIHGDEFGHWVSDAQGNELVQGEDGWWKPAATEAAPAIQQRAALRRAAANARRRSAPRRASNFGSPRIPVILVGFKDKAFSKSADDFDALLNQEGYTQNGAVGSVSDYYKENSLGAFTPVFDVYGPVQVDTTMAYYGTNDYFGNDMRAEMALVHAVQKLDDQIDFTRYDNDGDGQVDFIMCRSKTTSARQSSTVPTAAPCAASAPPATNSPTPSDCRTSTIRTTVPAAGAPTPTTLT